MDLQPCFKVHNLVSVYPKSVKLGQMTTLNVFFHVVMPDYRYFETRPSSLRNFGRANSRDVSGVSKRQSSPTEPNPLAGDFFAVQ